MREGKGERDRRGGRRKGGQEPALPIKKSSPRPCQKTAVFFDVEYLEKIPTFH